MQSDGDNWGRDEFPAVEVDRKVHRMRALERIARQRLNEALSVCDRSLPLGLSHARSAALAPYPLPFVTMGIISLSVTRPCFLLLLRPVRLRMSMIEDVPQ